MVRLPARAKPATYDGEVAAPVPLPIVQGQRSERGERVDAARNRTTILDAAQRLLLEQGADSITMDRLACEAGVGKGTLFRRFGDRASLFHALLDEIERSLQEEFIRGPAPLGPGAPAAQRLIAFGHALLTLTEDRGDLLLAAAPLERGLRYRSPVHAAYRVHLVSLLDELSMPDVQYLADVLLASLTPELILHQRSAGMTIARLQDSWRGLVERLVR
jgi:AcrR family transcriptional regulator